MKRILYFLGNIPVCGKWKRWNWYPIMQCSRDDDNIKHNSGQRPRQRYVHKALTWVKTLKTVSLRFLSFQKVLVHLRAVGKLALHAKATNKTSQHTSTHTEHCVTPEINVFLLWIILTADLPNGCWIRLACAGCVSTLPLQPCFMTD